MLHELVQGLVGQQVGGGIPTGVDVTQPGEQDVEVLRGQVLQSQDGPGVVDQPRSGEGVLGQSGLQRLVAVQAAAGVQEEVRGTSEQEPQVGGAALKAVVDDPQDLLVVGVARLGVGQLVQVDHLVQANEQTGEPGHGHEPGEQLELVVEVRVVDDRAYPERGPGIGAGAVLPAQPAHRVGLELVVAGVVPGPVCGDHLGEVVAADHLRQHVQTLADDRLGARPRFAGLGQGLGDEPFHDTADRPTIRLSAGGHVSHQLGVQGTGLPAGGV